MGVCNPEQLNCELCTTNSGQLGSDSAGVRRAGELDAGVKGNPTHLTLVVLGTQTDSGN